MKKSLSNPDLRCAREALAHWLGEAASARAEIQPVPGGLSGAAIWKVHHGQQYYCLRRWPSHQSNLFRLQEIHSFQKNVGQRGCNFVPKLFPTATGTWSVELDNCAWELASWMEGTPGYQQAPSSEKRCTALKALAQLHNAAATLSLPTGVAETGFSPGLRERLERLTGLLHSGLAELTEHVEENHVCHELVNVAREILPQLHNKLPGVCRRVADMADRRFRLSWCLRDIHAENLLFEGDSLSGLVDFGAVAVDSVAIDLARLVRSLAENNSLIWQDCLKVYREARSLSKLEIDSICAFDQAGIVCSSANWLRWVFVEGRSWADSVQVAARLRLLAMRLNSLEAATGLAS